MTKKIINPRPFTVGGGHAVTLGLCGLCGRNLTLSGANNTGARCRFEGAQYDRAGFLLWDAATPGVQMDIRRRRAREIYQDAPNYSAPIIDRCPA